MFGGPLLFAIIGVPPLFIVEVAISEPGGNPDTIIGPLETWVPVCLGPPDGEPFRALTKLIFGFEVIGPGALILGPPGPCTIILG